jgi:4-hydroxy-tetrahydrodipicolinate reductase
MIKVIVNGCNGKIGKEIVNSINCDPAFSLVGATDFSDNLQNAILKEKPDVVIDFTNPKVAYENAKTIISNSVHAIIGTTGITPEQRDMLNEIAVKNKIAILIAPNFCIGAVLMMKFAAEAAKYMPNVEIVEYHHDQKADAPSGTAIATGEYINKINGKTNEPQIKSKDILNKNSQGALVGNIRIHSVRLPGFVASQEVILGEKGQTLKIRHDTINREAFMPGIVLAAKSLLNKSGLYYGLETLLFQAN